jgi:translation initiation factor 2 subunit 2
MTTSASSVASGNTWDGTQRDYTYTEMLERVNSLLREKNPALSTRKRHVLPPPEMVRVGTRKTMWANFPKICMALHRQITHVQSFVLAETGTQGSIDGNQRLVLKGRFTPKQIESLLKKYIVEYVTCHMCRNPETTLTRDSIRRLYFIQCESCNSTRSVAPIKSGFHATSRADRRAART